MGGWEKGMTGGMFRKRSYAVVLLVVLSLGVGSATVCAEEDDARALLSREQQLSEKVRLLRSEQKLLLLRKMLCSSDSKYLEIDLRAGEGTLKYRTRVLRSFRFSKKGGAPVSLPDGGILRLTAKEDGSPSKRRMVFDSSVLVLEGSNAARGNGGNGLLLSVGRKDLAALYYALEAGSYLYLKER